MGPVKESSGKKGKNAILNTFTEITKNPELFLSIQPERVEESKRLLKAIYDFGVACYHGNRNDEILQELEIDNLDEEQIWQQIELRNNAIWEDLLQKTSEVLSINREKYLIRVKDKQNNVEETTENASKSKEKKVKISKDAFKDVEDEEKTVSKTPKKTPKKKSVVDDDFFNLNEMNSFLDMEDKREMKKTGKGISEDEEYVDYFQKHSDDEFDATDAKFEDFFDDDDAPEAEQRKHAKKDASMPDEEDSENGEEIDEQFFNEDECDNEDEEEDDQTKTEKSTFEEREERLRSKIKEYEENALSERPWQLKGEVVATNRPQNSLLQEILEFDATTRPAPIITEETTMRLEDIIRRRIKDKAWDDVEKKTKIIHSDHEFRKKLILDQEKSKESLAQIYEKEYRSQIEKLEDRSNTIETEPKEHQEVRNLMKSLFIKLDALSNFHYTPKPAVPEIKIITNTPALNMEEVAPVAVSEAALLAPEEVRKRITGEMIGKEERTRMDKNRDRRKAKLKRKIKEKINHEKDLLKQQRGTLSKKNEKDMLLKAVTKNRNVKKIEVNENAKAPKTSKAFFTQLQDKTVSNKRKVDGHTKIVSTNLSAKKLKL